MCSAVSVLAQTTLIGLGEVVGLDVKYRIEDGYLECKLPEVLSDMDRIKAQAILKTMYMGLRNIQESYSKYVDIVEEKEEV